VFLRPPVRKYETENYYETDPEQISQSPDAGKLKGGKTVAKKHQKDHDRCCITVSHHITQEEIAWNSHCSTYPDTD